VLRNITEAATIFSPPLKPSNFIISGREQNKQHTAVKTHLTLAANIFIRFKQNSNAAHKIQSIGADRGGATPGVELRRGCDQSKHTFNYHSAEHI
jgi:hypothetical protein